MDKLEVALKLAYKSKGKELDADVVKLWLLLLRKNNITQEQAAAAVYSVIETSSYLPDISKVIKIVKGDPEQQLENDAQSAFIKVWDAISKVGIYKPVVFDDLKIHAALGNSGWLDLAEMTYDKKETFRAQFIRAYKGCSVTGNTPRVLAGAHGGKAAMVGNAEQCQAHLLEHKTTKSKAITAPMQEAKRIAAIKQS